MTYIEPNDIRTIMRKLPTSIQDSDIQVFINRAEAYVNGKLAGVFQVPFETPPELIKDIETDISIFFMAESFYSSQKPNLDEYQVNRFNRAKEMLEEIITGELVLTISGKPVSPSSSSSAGFASTNTEQIFNYEEPEW